MMSSALTGQASTCRSRDYTPVRGCSTFDRSRDDEERQVVLARAVAREHLVGLRRPRLVPFVGLRDAGEEVARPVRLAVHPVPDEGDRRTDGAHVSAGGT
jgi:hypothetical protein